MQRDFKYLTPIAMIFMVFALCDILSVYRLTSIVGITIAAGIYILPFYYFLEDLIAEVYGYKRFRQVVWTMLIATFIFACVLTFVIHLPVPQDWPYKQEYAYPFNHLFRIVIGGGCVAVMAGAFINGYIVSKWKVILKGKHFWLRSLGASAVGQGVQNIIGCLILYTQVLPMEKVLLMMLPLYVIQMSISAIILVPGTFIAILLKKIEGVEVFDYGINYNPFKLSVDSEERSTTNSNEL
jgi:uncharacterized integral membrane protein (TIGR00697 family)